MSSSASQRVSTSNTSACGFLACSVCSLACITPHTHTSLTHRYGRLTLLALLGHVLGGKLWEALGRGPKYELLMQRNGHDQGLDQVRGRRAQ